AVTATLQSSKARLPAFLLPRPALTATTRSGPTARPSSRCARVFAAANRFNGRACTICRASSTSITASTFTRASAAPPATDASTGCRSPGAKTPFIWTGAWNATARRSASCARASRCSTWIISRRPTNGRSACGWCRNIAFKNWRAVRHAIAERKAPMIKGADTLAAIRDRLGKSAGREYWRSLEELADTPAFNEWVNAELPRHAAAWLSAIDRREFLKLMGASLALSGLAGCLSSAPAPADEKIVPYVKQPEEIVPGKPLYFATAIPLGGYARGIVVESHMGRPTKVEGNPEHPANLGATDAITQASVLSLYDPDRSRVISNAGRITTWGAFFSALNAELEAQRLSQGAGLRVLTETVTSPTLAQQLKDLLTKFPKAKWHQYDSLGGDAAYAGARLAFGEPVETIYRLDRADVIVSLDADFLLHGPGAVRYAREFADRRRAADGQTAMNRL